MRRHLTLAIALLLPTVALGQPIYPNPRLTALSPCGGKAGSTVEITFNGTDLEEAEQLVFSHPGLTAKPVPPPEPDPEKKDPPPPPIKFNVTIAPNTPVGVHDVRLVNKWGISNPRAFAVNVLNEITETEPNSDVDQANPVELNTIVNGDITNNTDVDFFKVACKKGQRIIVNCLALEVDSRLTPDLRIYTPDERPLTQGRLYTDGDAVADFTATTDGEYLIRLASQAYQYGGADYFYRLCISTGPWIDAAFPPVVEPGKSNLITLYGRNLPGGQSAEGMTIDGQPVEMLTVNVTPPGEIGSLDFDSSLHPRTGGVDGFEYRIGDPPSNPILLAYATAPVVVADGPHQSAETAQQIPIPGEVCARLGSPRDRDWYTFTAKKGQTIYFEIFADRLGSPLDLFFTIRRKDNGQRLGDYDGHPSIPTTAGTFYTYTDDPAVRFSAPEDGEYDLIVASRSADPVALPRLVYRLVAREPQPDFRLVLVGNADPSSAGCTLRQSSSQNLQVVCYRHDGFEGEVELSIEGLPQGVESPPQVVGPNESDTQLVLTAAENAADSLSRVKIVGTAMIDGKKVIREARYGSQVWPTNQQGNVPAVSRLCRSLWLAVREKGPFGLETLTPEVFAAAGQNGVELKYKLNGFQKEFNQSVALRRLSSPSRTNGQIVNLPNSNVAVGKDVSVKFNLPGDTRTGTYNVVMAGFAQFQYQKDEKDKKQNVQVHQVTPPVRMVIYDRVAEISFANPKLEVEAGKEVELVVKLNRLFDYKGEFDVQVQAPSGVGGVSVQQVKVPADSNEAKLIVKVAANTKEFSRDDFKIRATAKVENVTLTHEEPFSLTVKPAPEEKK